jgi:hypothetical protein
MRFKNIRQLNEYSSPLQMYGKDILQQGYAIAANLDDPEVLENLVDFIEHYRSGDDRPEDQLNKLRVHLNNVGLDFNYNGKHFAGTRYMQLKLFGDVKKETGKGKYVDSDLITEKLGHGLHLQVTMSTKYLSIRVLKGSVGEDGTTQFDLSSNFRAGLNEGSLGWKKGMRSPEKAPKVASKMRYNFKTMADKSHYANKVLSQPEQRVAKHRLNQKVSQASDLHSKIYEAADSISRSRKDLSRVHSFLTKKREGLSGLIADVDRDLEYHSKELASMDKALHKSQKNNALGKRRWDRDTKRNPLKKKK